MVVEDLACHLLNRVCCKLFLLAGFVPFRSSCSAIRLSLASPHWLRMAQPMQGYSGLSPCGEAPSG